MFVVDFSNRTRAPKVNIFLPMQQLYRQPHRLTARIDMHRREERDLADKTAHIKMLSGDMAEQDALLTGGDRDF